MKHTPKKRFGQNFLNDHNIIDNIVQSINPQPNENLVEIGPGQAAITLPVLSQATKLTAIELDKTLIEPLQRKCSYAGDLSLIQHDALKFDFSSLITTPNEQLRVFGNLPYNISTPLIFHLLSFNNTISDMHFMLQKEVVDRMSAPPGSKIFGRLSIMVQYHCQVSQLFDISRHSFTPPPKVESSFVRLVPHITKPFIAENIDLFAKTVLLAFNARRKTIRNGLKTITTPDIIESCNISSSIRPEQLSVKDFVNIANAIHKTLPIE